jgi:hypothetical protein
MLILRGALKKEKKKISGTKRISWEGTNLPKTVA